MKSRNFKPYLLFFYFGICSVLSAQEVFVLPKIVDEYKIIEHSKILKDKTYRKNIDEISISKDWENSKHAVPDMDLGKFRGWIKYQFSSQVAQEVLFVNKNTLLDEVSFYLFEDGKLIYQNENQSKFTPIEEKAFHSRYFVYPIALKPNAHYELYYSGICWFFPVKFVFRAFTEKSFENYDRKQNLIAGIAGGTMVLIFFISLAIGLIFRLRIFLIYGFFVLTFGWVYFFLEGYWFQILPKFFFQTPIISFPYLIIYCYYFSNLLLLWFLFRVELIHFRLFRKYYQIVLSISIICSFLAIFSNFWGIYASDSFIRVFASILRILSLALNIFMILCGIKLFHKNQLAIWYLVAVIPGIISLSGLRIIELFVFKIWYSLPNFFLFGMLWHIIFMMMGLVVFLRKRFSEKVEIESFVEKVDNQVLVKRESVGNLKLSNREIDILKAFTNGFTYQEISDAMFISPHTVRTHIKNIYQKLEINSKAEAVRMAIEQGWI